MDAVAVDVVTEVEIARAPAEVAAFAGDLANSPHWYENIVAVVPRYSGAPEVGSRAEFTARFLGRSLTYTYEIRELEPGHRLVMSTDEGPIPMETTYTWEETPGGATRMTLRNRGSPSSFAGVASPLLERAMRRANRKDLARLKELLEVGDGQRGFEPG